MKFRRSAIAQNTALPINTTVTADLGVNPLSHLVITLRGINTAAVEATIAQILARMGNITVTRYGETIFNMTATDLFRWNMIWFRNNPILTNQVAVINATRVLTLIVPFCRQAYNPNEGIPATQRGEMQCQITSGSTDANLSVCSVQIEQVEMLGAKPKMFLKTTTLSQTMVSGIDNNLALPIGNKYAGITIFSTTVPTGTSFVATAQKMKLLIDNVEDMFALTQWESLHGEVLLRVGARAEYDLTLDDEDIKNYAIMDFSPNGTEDFLLETKGATASTLVVNAGDAQIVRAMISELVTN